MKRIVSILMTLLIIMSVAAVSTSALDSAETVVSVNKGDEIVYSLKLTVPDKVVGCDFSVYYDTSKLKVKEVADFTGNYDSSEWQATINYNLKDTIIEVWSILSGVQFDNRALITVKFEAVETCDTHISYYMRYLYPESMEMFTEYDFTCDVTVNGKKVIDNKAPELNVEEPQTSGQFINSVTGNSDDANINTADTSSGSTGNSNGGEANEDDVTTSKSTTGSTEATAVGETAEETTVSDVGSADDPATIDSTPSQADNDGGIFSSVWFWIIIAIVVLGGGACVLYFVKNKKKAPQAETENNSDTE